MTFKEYLADLKAGFDAKGDFVRLAKADASLPDVSTWAEMRSYMDSRRDSAGAIDAGAEVWSEYEAAIRKARNA